MKKEEPEQFGVCARCGRKFVPEWMDAMGKFSRCCGTCCLRNLADSMDLPEIYDDLGISRDQHSR